MFIRTIVLSLALGIGLIAAAPAAQAAVPGWAHTLRATHIPVANCVSTMASIVTTVTGTTPQRFQLNANTVVLRTFTANAGVFVHCTASNRMICGVPEADISVLTFSPSPQEAGMLR